MVDTIITVQGEYSAWFPAERATVYASVSADGAERDTVFTRAVTASDALRNLTESIFDKEAGPITWWSSDSVRVWSHRPWNETGEQVPLVYSSAISFSAKFKDFDALGRWVEAAAAIDLVTVGFISWDLTDATRTSATVEVRSRAVKDAVAKASVFAQSIGLGKVTAIALADPGMLGDPSVVGRESSSEMVHSMRMDSSAQGRPGSSELRLKPEEIAVASIVDARFVAS